MDILDKKIENLAEADFPAGLHGRIMRRVTFLRFRAPVIAILALLVFNVVVSGLRLWSAAEDSELFSILQSLFQGFELSAGFAGMVWKTLADSLPWWSLAILLANLAVGIYVIRIYMAFQKMAPKTS